MLPFGFSKTPNSQTHCKTNHKRKIDIRQQRSNAFSQNIYKTHIKQSTVTFTEIIKNTIKYTKFEHWQPSTNSHINFREIFTKPLQNTKYASVWRFHDVEIIKNYVKQTKN